MSCHCRKFSGFFLPHGTEGLGAKLLAMLVRSPGTSDGVDPGVVRASAEGGWPALDSSLTELTLSVSCGCCRGGVQLRALTQRQSPRQHLRVTIVACCSSFVFWER